MTSSSSFDLNKRFASSPSKKMKNNSNCSLDIRKVQLEDTVLKSSSWVKSQFLGSGSDGSVYMATRDNNDKEVVAIKSSEISQASSLMLEKKILTRLSSPFVVRCYGDEITRENNYIFGEKTNYNVILEYCSGHSLADLMKTKGGGFSDKDVIEFAKDILKGLSYIHSENIIHCDIKPDNIFLTHVHNQIRQNGYLAKIGDFGLAMEKGSIEYGNGEGHNRGTPNYMAPELITHGFVDCCVDIWAFGCTILEMLTGEVAWEEYNDLESEVMFELIGYNGFIPNIPDWLSEAAKDFLRRCLDTDHTLRWEISELENHPFLNI